MQGKKRIIVIIFSIIIMLFGIIGCAASFGGIYLVKNLNIGGTESQLVTTVSGTLNLATDTIENSSTALKNIASTVGVAKDSLESAADVLMSSSEALAEISETMNFEIIGIKPLEDTSQYFISIAKDLDVLSGRIDSLSRSLGTNVDDINRVSTDLGEISIRLDNFSTSLSGATGTELDFGIKNFLYIVLALMASFNIVFILIGLSLAMLNR